jgi:hypothetical protein
MIYEPLNYKHFAVSFKLKSYVCLILYCVKYKIGFFREIGID